jgi:hypothetical protein
MTEMQFSKRHHYLPKYYLKGFADSENKCFIFKKSKKKVSLKRYALKSILYQEDRNTIIYDGEKTDIIEQQYAVFDNQFAKLFELIRNGSDEDVILGDNGLLLLKQFIAIQYCRLPGTDKYIDSYLSQIDFGSANNTVIVFGQKIGKRQGIIELLGSDIGYRNYFKCFVLPLIILKSFSDDMEKGRWYIFDVHDEFAYHLCSDFPLILKNQNKYLSKWDDMILPLTKKRILVFSNRQDIKREYIDLKFPALIDAMQIGLSEEIVCGSNYEYLVNTSNVFYKYWGIENIEKLNNEIFSCLE